MQTVRDISRTQGVRWIFRGWLPSFVRLGPHTVATLFFLEQQKVIYRLLKEGTLLDSAIT
jgi:dicarboxylate transporter 10